uniref:PLAT domain-containing protein n=1 Tax=Branchiostoma floridae TaxID=7739 RepID=C3ZHW6_BRAFL|eukprot:XP_002591899.1 hypothetical protein BRAFLDRAFT_89416 [Branchiostoma floridae]
MEDVGDPIEKIRIGHDGKGWGAGWHLEKVEVRRLTDDKKVDKFQLEAVDLGKVFKVKIRHDNAMLNPAWFLDKVEVVDLADQETFVFHCERWLGKNKDDGKLERSLYVKGYEGDTSSTSSRRSSFGGSQLSLKSTSPSLKRKNSRGSLMDETIPEGPLIPYNVKVVTGGGDDNGTNANPYIIIMGPKKKTTGRIPLDLEDKSKFDPASVETFAIEGVDVGDVKRIEFGHDGVLPGQGWFVKEVELDVPTAGKHYYFPCKRWLAKDKEDGLISRVLTLQDAESTMLSYTPSK